MALQKNKEIPLISIQQLSLDDSNPRFLETLSQAELLAAFALDQKTAALAKHIAKFGIDPTSNAAVLPTGKSRFVVREGNRRLAALKLLNNPDLAGTATLVKRFQKIVESAAKAIPSRLPCIIFVGEDADEWVALKHSGPQNGEGTVDWDAQQRSIFNLRTGRADQNHAAQKLLEHAVANQWLAKAEADSIAITNLSRLLNDTEVQAIWGVTVGDTEMSIGVPKEKMKPFMHRLSEDWKKRTGKKQVGEIYQQEARREYAAGLVKELKIKVVESATAIGVTKATGARAEAKRSAQTANSNDRKYLVPTTFHIHIEPDRARAIYLELRKLEVEKYTNAVAMLFRTFVEWSAEHYCTRKDVDFPPDARLADKVQRAVAHMKKQPGANSDSLKPAHAIVSSPNSIFSAQTFHQYVHNVYHHPAPGDLKAHWSSLAPFFKTAWG